LLDKNDHSRRKFQMALRGSPYFHGFWHLNQNLRPNFLCVGPVVRIQALSQCCSRDKFIWVKTRRRSTWSWKDQDHENTVL